MIFTQRWLRLGVILLYSCLDKLEYRTVKGSDGVGVAVEDLTYLITVGKLEIGLDGVVGVVDRGADNLAACTLMDRDAERGGVGAHLVRLDNVAEKSAIDKMLVRIKGV